MKKISWLIAVLLVITLVFTACGSAAEKGSEGTADGTQGAGETKAFKVGLSNTFMYPWRAQMIDDMQRVFENYKGKGWVEGDLIIQHAGTDTNAQIAQIRNMINDGVDILLINPISADGLNEVVEEAVNAGVLVVAFDQAISAKGVYNVTIDHYKWGYQYADWLCNEMGGKGELAYIEGLPGHPANDDRVRGWKDAISKHPDIKIVGTAVGNWDNPGAQKAASQLIATNPNLKGILSMDGMALGIYNALRSAKKLDSVITTGETQVAVLNEWSKIKADHPEFKSFGLVNPPGIGATALGFALRLAQGRQFTGEWVNGNTYYYDAKVKVDASNFEDFYNKYAVSEGRPDSFYPDEWLSEEDLDALFK